MLHLDATASAYRRLGPEDVAELAARLPAHRAEQLLASVSPEAAADTRTHAARALGRRPRRFRLARTRRRARS